MFTSTNTNPTQTFHSTNGINNIPYSTKISKIAVNDWVTKDGLVGVVVDMGQNTKSGEVWVKWSGYELPMNELEVNLNRAIAFFGPDLANLSLPLDEGYCQRLVYGKYGVEAQMSLKHKKKPELWSLEKLASRLNNQNLLNPPFNQPTKLSLAQVRRDGGTQPRAAINDATVKEYVEDYLTGAVFPPVTVFYDGTDYWLADGFHRAEASRKANFQEILAIVKQGTRRDAVLYSVGANAKHGLRRSNADKRRAVLTLLEDEEWQQWSNNAIAKKCEVSLDLVNRLRRSLNESLSENKKSLTSSLNENSSEGNQSLKERTYITKHGTQAKMNTTNIGKAKQTKSSSPLDKVVIPKNEQQFTDEPVITSSFDENKYTEDVPVINNGNTNLKKSTSSKQKKGKPRLVNPLSIGDKVKVKEDNYFGGLEGIVTQLASPDTVIVAFDNGEREFLKLAELDLPASLSFPIIVNESKPKPKPVKKEVVIQEGVNYKAGDGCSWYVKVSPENYHLLQEYQQKVGAVTLDGAIARFLQSEKERELEESTPNTNDLLVNLVSKVEHLNQPQFTTVVKACHQAKPTFFEKVTNQLINPDSETINNQSDSSFNNESEDVNDTFIPDDDDYLEDEVLTPTSSSDFPHQDLPSRGELESTKNQPLTINEEEKDEESQPQLTNNSEGHISAKIYINRQVVNANKKASKEIGMIVDEPAIAIKTYRGSIYAQKVVLLGEGTLIQDSTNPLSEGASIWIETKFSDLIIDGEKANLNMFHEN